MTEKCVVILKPDAVTRGLVGEITTRLEKTGLKLVGCKMSLLTTELLENHYAHLADKPFFPGIVSYMQSGAVLIQAWEGKGAAALIRKLIGATNSAEALPGTIRGDFSLDISRNTIHASESAEEGIIEVKRFFTEDELCEYKRCDAEMICE